MDSSREYYNRIYLHNLNISSHPKYFKQRYSPFHALNQRSILLETEGNNKLQKLYSSVYILLQLHCMSNDGRDHFLPRVGGWQRNEVIFWGCQYSVVYGSKVMWGVGREWERGRSDGRLDARTWREGLSGCLATTYQELGHNSHQSYITNIAIHCPWWSSKTVFSFLDT